MKQELDADTRDVSGLWNEALKKYKGIVGVELQAKFQSVDEMIAYGTDQMNNFHKFRHDQKKVDKLRSLFVANMSLIEKGAQQLVAAATPAFPPAAAIGTAFTYMLNACRQVSADYNVVTAFFEDMNAFLQRISILESRLPSNKAYRNCLMDVFTSLLEMCGFATKYIELGRFKKWLINLSKGEDGELGGARKRMDVSLKRLQDATEYAILGNTEEVKRMNADLQKNQDLQLNMAEEQNKMLQAVMDGQDTVKTELQSIQKLLVMFDQRRKDEGPKQGASKAASQNKPPTSNRVRSSFPESTNPEVEYKSIKDNFIPETGSWIFEEDAWNLWATQDAAKNPPKILAVSGPPGSGKSHLAVSAYDKLFAAANGGTGETNVGYFFFRETTKDLQYFYQAINWLVIQLAEQNTLMCERINVELAKEDSDFDSWGWEDVWGNLVKPFFGKSSKSKLQIVLDGVDELMFGERDNVTGFLKMVSEATDLNVTVFCTTRETLVPALTEMGAAFIEIVKEKQSADLKALVWQHLNKDSGLRKFARYMKQRIATELEEKADGMLYAEHMLRQFNTIGREPLILKQLATAMPKDIDELYENILADVQRHIQPSQHASLKTLLAWLSFSREPLTLGDSLGLLRLQPGDVFDLEDELQGSHLSRLLKIAGVEERSDEDEDETSLEAKDPESGYDDADLPLKFQERSMRGFFRSTKPGDTGLRTAFYEAHRRIFVTCSDIICGRAQGVKESLKKYAAASWAYHLSFAALGKPGVSDEENILGLEAMGRIMSNEDTGAANILESLGVDYKELARDFREDWFLGNFKYYASGADKYKDKLSQATVAWAAETSVDQNKALVPLASAHVANMLQAKDMKLALRSYRFARTALKRTSLGEFLDEEEEDIEEDGLEDQEGENSEQDILGMVNAFPDIPKDANSHWVIAGLLHHSRHWDAALSEANQGLEIVTDTLDRFRLLDLKSNISIGLEDYEESFEAIKAALALSDLPPNLLRRGYVTRAKAEAHLKRLDDSVASFEAARHADPGEPMAGDVLQAEFATYNLKNVDSESINVVKKWTPLEKLSFMTWRYDMDSDHHEYFRRLAGRTGQQEFLVQAYEEVIEMLDRVDAAAPIRLELAQAYWDVLFDAEKAKGLLDEVLKTNSTGYFWRFTNEDPVLTLTNALLYSTDIIYEEFRATSDRDSKAKLLAEAKGLMEKPLARSLTPQKSDLTHYNLTLARMARKVGSLMEFQDLLELAFQNSYELLEDTVGWNDYTSLLLLAKVLSTLPGLDKEVEILMSATFSELDMEDEEEEEKKEEGDKDGEDDEEESDDEEEDEDLPTDQGDLSGAEVSCSGECLPQIKWRFWEEGKPLYQCTICSDTLLCEPCYQKRQAYNAGEPSKVGSNYCNKNHKYIKGPMPGWKGIKDGIMTIEGSEPVPFKEWLVELKEKKWKNAWERFWLAED
ncbi:hypothetical protein GQ53DRAFT_695857 [Thozetella sp. PMI_491]|nr:hypothetical protein GQ53DRAFT_695857 [Thozetella sp. PMI_491]